MAPKRARPRNPELEEALASLRETRGQVSAETYREMEAALRRKYGGPPRSPGLHQLLLHPERFMAERARQGMALGLPAACTLTLGALGNINIFNYAPRELFARFYPEPPLLALALLGAISISMFTLFLTALYRFVSVLLGGAGTYMKMLELVGTASLPLALAQGVLLPLGTLGIPQKMAGPLAGILLIPFVTWYFYLLLQAIHHSTELPMDRSAAVILIPLAAGALLGAAMLPNLQQFQGSLGRTGG